MSRHRFLFIAIGFWVALTLLLVTVELQGQVNHDVPVDDNLAAVLVRNAAVDSLTVTVEGIFRDIERTTRVQAILSPRSFVLAPGGQQIVRVLIQDSTTTGEVLRLSTRLSPMIPTENGVYILMDLRLVTKLTVR